MELKYYGGSGKTSPRRSDQLRSFRGRSQSRTSNTRSSFDTIAKAIGGGHVVSQTEEDGVVRMKIVVKKQDLKQMFAPMGGCNNNNNNNNKDDNNKKQANLPRLSVEQRLNLLRKKHLLRTNLAKQNRRASWSPVLQSIPEEL